MKTKQLLSTTAIAGTLLLSGLHALRQKLKVTSMDQMLLILFNKSTNSTAINLI